MPRSCPSCKARSCDRLTSGRKRNLLSKDLELGDVELAERVGAS